MVPTKDLRLSTVMAEVAGKQREQGDYDRYVTLGE
jgi:hypothetical protein